MKQMRHLLSDARRHKGLALIIVLSMLALATIVILAFLSVADTEYKATTTFSSSQNSRRLADTAVNIVISQIRSGTEQDDGQNGRPNFAGREFHATQPGAVRKYSQHGAFLAGYKLFSDKDMIFRPPGSGAPSISSIDNEHKFVLQSEPPAGWNSGDNTSRYTDLNEPVIKGVADNTGNPGLVQTFFPILDPRAAMDMDPAGGTPIPVEGFSYETTTALNGNDLSSSPDNASTLGQLPPVQKPGTAPLDNLRLAMPVQWLYVLKDGTVGHLDEDLNFVAPAGAGNDPSESNPIVGRFAFWADDESCKVNINTASEPTFLGQPIYYHERDHRWADYPAARSEYQRFPGHPATVALSSVLYPNPYQTADRSLDNYTYFSGNSEKRILSVKQKIYDLMPRIHYGGSVAGTQLFETDDYSTGAATADAVRIQEAMGERLYASVDELIFSEQESGGQRVLNNATVNSGLLFNKQTLERASAFLTASSRSSEISMFGLPRIAMWPLAEEAARRTGFDNLIQFCSRVGSPGNDYIFRRAKPRNANYDISLQRNVDLMNMLDNILTQTFPAATEVGGTGSSFVSKLGRDNARQLLVEMFDYIRVTNLFDSFLVKDRDNWPSAAIDWTALYQMRDGTEGSSDIFKTYTPGVVRNSGDSRNPFADKALPGHGQVTPSLWRIGGKNFRGLGRSISISEIGMHFICTADGQPDMYSWRLPKHSDEQTPDPDDAENFEIPVINGAAALNAEAFDIDNNKDGIVSGGRTALRIDRSAEIQERGRVIVGYEVPGFDGNAGSAKLSNLAAVNWNTTEENKIKERYYSNYPPLNPATAAAPGLYGTTLQPGFQNYGKSPRRHPGYNWRNWNWTLDFDTPLKVDEKRVQAMLHLEFFCPAVGYPVINPEFTIVLSGSELSNIEVNGKSIFPTGSDVIIKSGGPLFDPDGSPEVGGFASFRKISTGRLIGPRPPMPDDKGYSDDSTGNTHSGLTRMDLVSSFFTVNSNKSFDFSSGTIRIKIYDSHDYQGRDPMQTIDFKLIDGKMPPPSLVVFPSLLVDYIRPDGTRYVHSAIQAPHWWTFNAGGALGRRDADGNYIHNNDESQQQEVSLRGRIAGVPLRTNDVSARDDRNGNQAVPGGTTLIYAGDSSSNFSQVPLVDAETIMSNLDARIAYGGNSSNIPNFYGMDTVRTILPAHGDPRLITVKGGDKNDAAKPTEWSPHPLYSSLTTFVAHNFSSYRASGEPGFDRRGREGVNTDQLDRRVLPVEVKNGSGVLNTNLTPDAPFNLVASASAQRYYDFDDTDPGGRVGPFINKPDEGNFAVGDFKGSDWSRAYKWRATYFGASSFGSREAPGTRSFFTPNRMISSPVMMGSLPSRALDPLAADGTSPGAWTNLLFRPHVQGATGTKLSHPGQGSPPDHYLLDLFWMPVVEPYAISESLSTAGKINMNYQMLPFTHIRRATALHAAMKGELFSAMPNSDYELSKSVRSDFANKGATRPEFRNEVTDKRFWHRSIVIDRFNPTASDGNELPWWTILAQNRVQGTLRQFEERFNFSDTASGNGPSGIGNKTRGGLPSGMRAGLFRSPSQICEIHLIPSNLESGSNPGNPNFRITASDMDSSRERSEKMGAFWAAHCSTGDNTRERPYANLYAKLTTRSNTFRVHVRSQTIRKALRSVDPDQFDPSKDIISSEFRGSFLLERYIDNADLIAAGAAVDYAKASAPLSLAPLDSYYRFRVTESKRFAP